MDTNDLDIANPCPICHQEMKHEYSLVNEGTVGESSDVCPDGHYNCEFSYGYYRLSICGETWMFSYDQTVENGLARQREMQAVIKQHRLPTRDEIVAQTTFLDLLPESV